MNLMGLHTLFQLKQASCLLPICKHCVGERQRCQCASPSASAFSWLVYETRAMLASCMCVLFFFSFCFFFLSACGSRISCYWKLYDSGCTLFLKQQGSLKLHFIRLQFVSFRLFGKLQRRCILHRHRLHGRDTPGSGSAPVGCTSPCSMAKVYIKVLTPELKGLWAALMHLMAISLLHVWGLDKYIPGRNY